MRTVKAFVQVRCEQVGPSHWRCVDRLMEVSALAIRREYTFGGAVRYRALIEVPTESTWPKATKWVRFYKKDNPGFKMPEFSSRGEASL